ncbi:hypothetical protein LKD70_16195 [Ruminococcus sp. CLA-AA-H200]|uniref:Uncharacterized protein n=1 Tax=Ruminococcus turbiniformis TaxID=2881258 RepID=A0ABS8G0U8_9FIRM|nr:hypothetical protein [Ruminococcus turbiniformis]MCC2255933.1 hypothetical protein [Ruminococcus turbiniformis]
MNIFRFINSKDIRRYLREIQYQFTVPEAAFLIYMSRIVPLKEKFDAWQKIINTMPDCSLEERLNMKAIPSFHRFLEDYMALQKKMLACFYRKEQAIYTIEFFEKEPGKYDWVDLGLYFPDYQTAVSNLTENWLEDDVEKIRITKHYFADGATEQEKKLWIETDRQLNVLSLGEKDCLSDSESGTAITFEGMWFSFPTPFHRGDVLIDQRAPDSPIVLQDISTWGQEELLRNGFSGDAPFVINAEKRLERCRRHGDTSDMNYCAYYLAPDRTGEDHLYSDIFWSYLDLERYEKPLEGEAKILSVVAGGILPDRQKQADVELVCNAVLLIIQEEQCRKLRKWMEEIYTKESLEALGLVKNSPGGE